MNQEIQILSTMDQNIFVSQLRSQINKLKTIVQNFEIERFHSPHEGTQMKEVEIVYDASAKHG